MAIQVTYRRTRRLSMRIVKNGDVHVSAPIGMPKKEVERFIEEHRDWITEARKKTYESQKRRAEFYNQLPLKTREQADELYLDSLAVLPGYRRQGIAQRLLSATKDKADKVGLPCVGLLVDKANPAGEALYASVGFRYANDSWWGGHPMKHLVL